MSHRAKYKQQNDSSWPTNLNEIPDKQKGYGSEGFRRFRSKEILDLLDNFSGLPVNRLKAIESDLESAFDAGVRAAKGS